MDRAPAETYWQNHALLGRPDFLNYVPSGDITWDGLWSFYRGCEADTASVQRLMSLFHAAQSLRFDAEGCPPDPESTVRTRLAEWARFAVEHQQRISEDAVRENLAGLLESNLITPLYYEAAFAAYLEAALERCAVGWRPGNPDPAPTDTRPAVPVDEGQLPLRLAEVPEPPAAEDALPNWNADAAALISRSHQEWNQSYEEALGDEEPEWIDLGVGD